MKRIALTAIASALVLGGGAFAATAGSGAQARPWLRLADTDPVTVRGGNFKAGEQVTVTVKTVESSRTRTRSKAAKATTRGSFTATLSGVEIDECGLRTSITAIGDAGTRAAVKFMPRPCGSLP